MMRYEAEQRAQELGIHADQHLSLRELIYAIQQAQGKEPCFRSDGRYHCQGDCEWSAECKRLLAEWRR